jgi:hypothetical protein
MPFGLQSNIPDRALPDALRTLLVQQTTALEALLQYAQKTMETLRANGTMSTQKKTTQRAALAKDATERLSVLENKHIQIQAQLEAFQQLLRQQGNPILTYTVEQVKEVLEHNLTVARLQLDVILHGQSP